MKKILSKVLILFFIILSYSCTTVAVRKHPDYNFRPTIPSSIKIYNKDLMPIKKFIIIGEIQVDSTWALSGKESRQKAQKEAAKIGGDGLLMLNTKIDVYAFNRGVKTTGRVDVSSHTITYSETRRDTTTYIPIIISYGYVIKFIE